MQNRFLNTKTALAFLVVLSLCFSIWFLYPGWFGGSADEKPVACDAGGFFKLNNVLINIPAEYMQNVYAAASKKPQHGGKTYTCADMVEKTPLPVTSLRFFPEAFLNKNILIDDTPYKTITPLQIRSVPPKEGAPAAVFSCNDRGQCAAVVIKEDVLFMVELSEAYFSSGLQKNIFYASFQRFVESLLSTPHVPAAE